MAIATTAAAQICAANLMCRHVYRANEVDNTRISALKSWPAELRKTEKDATAAVNRRIDRNARARSLWTVTEGELAIRYGAAWHRLTKQQIG